METAEIRQLIQTGIPDCELIVSGEGCSFSVVVIADEFDGMSPVKRQQRCWRRSASRCRPVPCMPSACESTHRRNDASNRRNRPLDRDAVAD
jgi:hypothetical protein